jgi:hypothetical protein
MRGIDHSIDQKEKERGALLSFNHVCPLMSTGPHSFSDSVALERLLVTEQHPDPPVAASSQRHSHLLPL